MLHVVGCKWKWTDDVKLLNLTLEVEAKEGEKPAKVELTMTANTLSEFMAELEKANDKYSALFKRKSHHDGIDRTIEEMRRNVRQAYSF